MDVSVVIQKFTRLPDALKAEAEDFIDFLFAKAGKAQQNKHQTKGYGLWKGKIEMSQDFDAPLEDFKEYME